MAKKKNDSRLVYDVILLILSVATLITLFVGMVKATGTASGTELWTATGGDLIKSAFASELKGLEGGAASIYSLAAIEENAFIVGAFQWCYIVSMVAAAACLVFTVLDMLHIRLRLFNKLCAIVLVLGSLATMVFGFLTAGKATGGLFGMGSTGSVAFGLFLLIAGIVYTVVYFVKEQN